MGLRSKLFGNQRDESETIGDAMEGKHEGGSAKSQTDLMREIEDELAKQSRQNSASQPDRKPQPAPDACSPAGGKVVATEDDYFVEDTVLECFYENENIDTVYVHEGVTEIGELSFYDSYIWEVHLPDTVRAIGNSAFEKSTYLTTVVLPEGLQEIGNEAFRSCPQLEDIKLPTTLQVIGIGAFRNCPRLYELVLPDSLREIGEGAFSECENLDFIAATSKAVESLLRASGYTGIISATLEEGRVAAREAWHAKMQAGSAQRQREREAQAVSKQDDYETIASAIKGMTKKEETMQASPSEQKDVIADLEKLLYS